MDHPNIIKCYRAWHDKEGACINFITEFFTSGNLRDYRQRHKHLEVGLHPVCHSDAGELGRDWVENMTH